MRRLLLAMVCVWSAACSDDASSSNNKVDNNSSNNATNNTTNNASNNANNNATVDMGTGEPDADLDMSTSDAGTDAQVDAEADSGFPDVGSEPCAFPTTDDACPMGPYGPATFLSELVIPETATCCFDYTGDGEIDNKIGQLLATAKGLGFDVNTGISDSIAAGQLVNLFVAANLNNLMYDPFVDLAFHKGTDTDLDFGPNLLGLGDFYVLPDSLAANGLPKWTFESARVNNGKLEAFDGQMDLDFPELLDEVRIPVVQGRVEASILMGSEVTAGGRITLDQGKLGGVVLRDEFFESLNAASLACTCLQRAVYDRQPNGGYTCNSVYDDRLACQGASSGCQFLAYDTYCGLLGTAISNAVDVDTDNDGKPDSYSFGATFTGVGASVLGNAQ